MHLFRQIKKESERSAELLKVMSLAMKDYEAAHVARFGKKPSKAKLLAWRDGFVAAYSRQASS